MSIEEAQKWIDKYEGKKPASLKIFLEYMGFEEDEFNKIVSKFIIPPFNQILKKLRKETQHRYGRMVQRK